MIFKVRVELDNPFDSVHYDRKFIETVLRGIGCKYKVSVGGDSVIVHVPDPNGDAEDEIRDKMNEAGIRCYVYDYPIDQEKADKCFSKMKDVIIVCNPNEKNQIKGIYILKSNNKVNDISSIVDLPLSDGLDVLYFHLDEYSLREALTEIKERFVRKEEPVQEKQ